MTEITPAQLKRQASEFRFLVTDLANYRQNEARAQPLFSFEQVEARGQELARQFEASQATLGTDREYVAARKLFLCSFGDLYGGRLDFAAVGRGDAQQCAWVHQACVYYQQSNHPLGALALARIFHHVGFYGTALYWYDLTERVVRKAGADNSLHELACDAAGMIQALYKSHNTTDPVLSPAACFPTRDTPGLLLKNQPAIPQSPTSPSGAPHPAVPAPTMGAAGMVGVASPQAGAAGDTKPAESEQVVQDQQAKFRALEEQRAAEKLREHRLEYNLCLTCGLPLRMADKVARRQIHKECAIDGTAG
ncbi:MAG: hypothetical protein JOZ57_14465 [Abitibacteriaceae bacterium]|nr:hypothetical protein [Abditibacteriaceae bacterium]